MHQCSVQSVDYCAFERAWYGRSLSGIPIEIPWKTWYLAKANKACVQKTPPMFPGVLIGDVLFRRYVVLYAIRTFVVVASAP